MKNKLTSKQAGIIYGWRSGLEEKNAEWLEQHRVRVNYEQFKIYYIKRCKYTADFELPNGIIVETKGRFLPSDRGKHLLIKKQYPHLDIRFVFQNSRTKLSPKSKTTYGQWCEQHGFMYADKLIPEEWMH